MSALINGEVGWLMYLRGEGDAGFSSRNPDYAGPPGEMVEHRLGNGQHDRYPRAWAYPVATVERALEHFRTTGLPPTFIQWHNDLADGEGIVPRPARDPERSGRIGWNGHRARGTRGGR